MLDQLWLGPAIEKCSRVDLYDARLRNQASVTEQDVRKCLMCHLPVFLPYHNRLRKLSGKGAEFYKTNISKKGVGKFSKISHLESARCQLSIGMLRLF